MLRHLKKFTIYFFSLIVAGETSALNPVPKSKLLTGRDESEAKGSKQHRQLTQCFNPSDVIVFGYCFDIAVTGLRRACLESRAASQTAEARVGRQPPTRAPTLHAPNVTTPPPPAELCFDRPRRRRRSSSEDRRGARASSSSPAPLPAPQANITHQSQLNPSNSAGRGSRGTLPVGL